MVVWDCHVLGKNQDVKEGGPRRDFDQEAMRKNWKGNCDIDESANVHSEVT